MQPTPLRGTGPWIAAGLLALVPGCADAEPPPAEGPSAATIGDSGGSGATAAVALEIPADAPRVVFLGDSLSAGLHLAAHEAFPALLQRELFEAGLAFHLTNAGVSGDTSAGGLARLDWLLGQEPDLVVVELGANDALRGQPLEATERNLRRIVERSLAAGARVLLLGLHLPPNYGPDYAEDFHALFGRVAGDLDVPLVPYFLEGVGGDPDMNLPDGLHPNRAGHERVAQNLRPALEAILRELTEAGRQ